MIEFDFEFEIWNWIWMTNQHRFKLWAGGAWVTIPYRSPMQIAATEQMGERMEKTMNYI